MVHNPCHSRLRLENGAPRPLLVSLSSRLVGRCASRRHGRRKANWRASNCVVGKAPTNGSTATSDASLPSVPLMQQTEKWIWRSHAINYVVAGEGDPILLVHGFGANTKHFRKNIPVLAEDFKVYALDLLGFGDSPKAPVDYSMELWRDLILDFQQQFIEKPVVIVGNSVGSLASLMAASSLPEGAVRGTVLLNCAGAMNNKALSDDWRLKLARPIFLLIDILLNIRPVASFLFEKYVGKENIRNILLAVYSNADAVDDELVNLLHAPSQETGALDVFVSVITGPPGPRPESLIPDLDGPLLLLWGEEDPFTPMDGPIGKFFQSLPDNRPNTQFVRLAGVGHCPHDDRPELVHSVLLPWLKALQ